MSTDPTPTPSVPDLEAAEIIGDLLTYMPRTILTQDMGKCLDCGTLTDSGMKRRCALCLRKKAKAIAARLRTESPAPADAPNYPKPVKPSDKWLIVACGFPGCEAIGECQGHVSQSPEPSPTPTSEVREAVDQDLEAVGKAVVWMEWWTKQNECSCDEHHVCGLPGRKKEMEAAKAAHRRLSTLVPTPPAPMTQPKGEVK